MPIRYLNQTDPNRPAAAKPVFGKNALSVLAMYASVILVIVVGLAFALAKTGLVSVPFFSRWYVGPTPVRAIRADTIDATAFRVLVSGRLLSQIAAKKPPPYAITLSEKELTGALRGVVDQALRNEDWKTRNAQLAVTPDYLEFSGTFVRDVFRVDLRVRARPVVEDGGLRFEATDIRIGDYPIHPSIAERIVGMIFARDLGTWIVSFGDISLKRATLGSGSIDLVATQRSP